MTDLPSAMPALPPVVAASDMRQQAATLETAAPPTGQSAERLNRLIATVKNIAQSLELREILPEIIKDASELLGAESGDILLWDRERNVLKVVAVYRFPADMLDFEMPLGEGLSSQAMASRRPVMVPDYLSYPRRAKALDHYRFKAVLSVPLISRGQAIGAINVHAASIGHRYSQDDINLLTAFADHAAVAIDNAQRYENEKRIAADLRALNARLSRSLAIQQQFTQQALQGHGLTGLVRRLATIIARPVVVEDPFFRLLASSAPDERPCPEIATPPALQRDPTFKAALVALARSGRPAALAHDPARLLTPLLAADDVLGYLTVLSGGVALSDLDQVAVELAATNCALELLKQRAAFEAEARLRGDFVLDLIGGNFHEPEAIITRAAFLGHNLNGPFDLLLLEVRCPDGSMTERESLALRRRAFESVHRWLSHRAPQSLIASQADNLIVLLSRAPAAEGGIGDRPGLPLAEALRQELAAVANFEVSGALSETCRAPRDFARAYQDAQAALALMKSLGRGGELVDCRDLGFYGLLLRATPHDRLAGFARARLQPLRDYDAQHHTELLGTLQLYFRHGGRKKEAAQAAFLHVNTLTYRLRKAEQILGASLRNPDDLLQLQFAFKILDVMPLW